MLRSLYNSTFAYSPFYSTSPFCRPFVIPLSPLFKVQRDREIVVIRVKKKGVMCMCMYVFWLRANKNAALSGWILSFFIFIFVCFCFECKTACVFSYSFSLVFVVTRFFLSFFLSFFFLVLSIKVKNFLFFVVYIEGAKLELFPRPSNVVRSVLSWFLQKEKDSCSSLSMVLLN